MRPICALSESTTMATVCTGRSLIRCTETFAITKLFAKSAWTTCTSTGNTSWPSWTQTGTQASQSMCSRIVRIRSGAIILKYKPWLSCTICLWRSTSIRCSQSEFLTSKAVAQSAASRTRHFDYLTTVAIITTQWCPKTGTAPSIHTFSKHQALLKIKESLSL